MTSRTPSHAGLMRSQPRSLPPRSVRPPATHSGPSPCSIPPVPPSHRRSRPAALTLINRSAALVGENPHASLWSGSSSSWIDLHPAGTGFTSSVVSALDGGQQFGSVGGGLVTHASMWSGTAASWVDLHPAAATSSVIHAAANGLQGGSVTLPGSIFGRASLWSGAASSWMDLHPAGATASTINGVGSGKQVSK